MHKYCVKNMVCNGCKVILVNELKKFGLHYKNITLGEVELEESIPQEMRDRINAALRTYGLELIDDRKRILVEKIRNAVAEFIDNSNDPLKVNLSDYLSRKLDQSYTYLSHLFSEIHGTSIEKYYIMRKIEKVKELITYDELSLSEIAFKLNYSSVAHLSGQFKKITGFTPSFFRQLRSREGHVTEPEQIQ